MVQLDAGADVSTHRRGLMTAEHAGTWDISQIDALVSADEREVTGDYT